MSTAPPNFRPVPPSLRPGALSALASQGPSPVLGALEQLPGTWIGKGFNLIARPNHEGGTPFFLELNATDERIEFNTIGSPIPNRGSLQDDIVFVGLHYLQQVSDAVNGGALHLEPGLWLNVPATTVPPAGPSIVRLATVPHGDSVLAQGTSSTNEGGPTIAPVSSTPTEESGAPITNLGYLDPFETTPLPPGIPEGATANPNLVLSDAIEGQHIVQTTVLDIATSPDGGIDNIPFVVQNADATSMRAVFWIEVVEHPEGFGQYLQLQYTQTVNLQFLGIDWPHISVATLVKAW